MIRRTAEPQRACSNA